MGLNFSKLRQRAEATEKKQNRSNRNIVFYTVKQGPQTIRILPPDYKGKSYIPDNELAKPIYTHHGPHNTKVTCMRDSFPDLKKACVVCEAYKEFYIWCKEKGLSKDDRSRLLNGYYQRISAYTNCIDKSSVTEVEINGTTKKVPTVMIVGLPSGVFNDLISTINMHIQDGEEFDPTDSKTGRDLIIKREGVGMMTKYQSSFKTNSTPIHQDPEIADYILSNMYNISEIFRPLNQAGEDEAAALAEEVRNLMNNDRASELKGTAGPSASERASASSVVGSSILSRPQNDLSSGKPDCYLNYVPSLPKCKACVYSDTCEPESDPMHDIETRKSVHATSTWMRPIEAA
jgi:hypothetical protein